MKHGKDFDEVLKRGLPSASKDPKEQLDVVRNRVLHRVLSEASSYTESTVWNSRAPSILTWPRIAIFSAAATLLLAVLVAEGWRQNPALAIVEDADGSSRNLSVSDTVRSSHTGTTVILADGSRIEMKSNSELSLKRADDGVRIDLVSGVIIVNAAKQPQGHLYVQTKDATISVVGTVFLVNEESEGSRVGVIEGEVHVRLGAAEKSLAPGEQVMTTPRMEWQPVSEQIAWSRHAEEHLALLQQSTPLSTQGNPRPSFELASVKPIDPASMKRGHEGHLLDRERYVDRTELLQFIVRAYLGGGAGSCLMTATPAMGQYCPLISGVLPEWVKKERFEIQAKMPPNSVPSYTYRQARTQDTPELNLMLQVLLEDRFHLKAHREVRELPVYVLTVAKGGPKLKKTPPEGRKRQTSDGILIEIHGLQGVSAVPTQDGIQRMQMDFLGSSMKEAAEAFGIYFDRPIMDRTGINGEYDFTIEYDVEPTMKTPQNPFSGLTPSALSVALQAVGLKLESTKAPVEILVIDHVEKPSEN